MSIIGFPLLLIPLAICNIVIFLMPGVGFDVLVTRVPLPSGAVWTINAGDVLVALGVLLLLFEVIKASRPGGKYVTDHLLSLLVLGGTVAEFVMLPQFATGTVFLLASLMLVDFLAGIALRRRPQPRIAHEAPAAPPAKSEPEKAEAMVRKEPTLTPAVPGPSSSATPAAAAPAPTSSASTSAASMAEAVLLDRPQPVAPSGSAPQEQSGQIQSQQAQSPTLQPAAPAGPQQPQP